MSETFTISESRYNTAYLSMVVESCIGILLLSGSLVVLSLGLFDVLPSDTSLLTGGALAVVGYFSLTMCKSKVTRGFWYRFYRDEPYWVLDDVDRCELAGKGTVEVTIDE